jgi:hypothetical protein
MSHRTLLQRAATWRCVVAVLLIPQGEKFFLNHGALGFTNRETRANQGTTS